MSKIMNKRNQILAAVLVVQLIVIAVVFWPRNTAAGGGEAVFTDLDQVVQITIADNAGSEIVLTRSHLQDIVEDVRHCVAGFDRIDPDRFGE